MATALREGDREVAPAARARSGSGRPPSGCAWSSSRPRCTYYRVLANPVLWFVQHGLWELKRDPTADLSAAWADGYVAANRALAAAAVEELDALPGAPLLVQDYHLYLVPALVREARPDARIAHFVHIPWVGPDGWSVLPEPIVRAVHEGLLAADSIGFHTSVGAPRSSRRARRCSAGASTRRLGHAEPDRDRRVRPRAAGQEPGRPGAPTRAAGRAPRALVLRVDRTDPSKNAVRGFAAFGRLLELEPGSRGGSTARAPRPVAPGRSGYVDYRDATGAAAPRSTPASAAPAGADRLDVRDDFPASSSGVPRVRRPARDPVKDGLNLVAKEAPLVNERDGAVVLSREAGAYEGLRAWVVGVDPADVGDLRAAQSGSRARSATRRAAVRDHVRMHDLDAWAEKELEELERRAPRVREQAGYDSRRAAAQRRPRVREDVLSR